MPSLVRPRPDSNNDFTIALSVTPFADPSKLCRFPESTATRTTPPVRQKKTVIFNIYTQLRERAADIHATTYRTNPEYMRTSDSTITMKGVGNTYAQVFLKVEK